MILSLRVKLRIIVSVYSFPVRQIRKGLPIIYILLAAIFSGGCAILKLPFEVVKTTGTVVKTTGQVVGVVGSGVVTTAQVVGKFVEVGGKVVEAVVKTPGATELIITKIKP